MNTDEMTEEELKAKYEELKKSYLEDINDAIEKLEVATRYEGSEVGECWDAAITLWRYRYALSDDLQKSLKEQIVEFALELEFNYEFVEEEVTHTFIEKRLEYKWD